MNKDAIKLKKKTQQTYQYLMTDEKVLKILQGF